MQSVADLQSVVVVVCDLCFPVDLVSVIYHYFFWSLSNTQRQRVQQGPLSPVMYLEALHLSGKIRSGQKSKFEHLHVLFATRKSVPIARAQVP